MGEILRPNQSIGRITPNAGNDAYIKGGQRVVTLAPSFPVVFNGRIPDLAGQETVALTPYPAGLHFQSAPGRTFAAVGVWPPSVSVNGSTGEIAGTPGAGEAGTYPGLQVQCTEGGGSALSNYFSLTIAVAP